MFHFLFGNGFTGVKHCKRDQSNLNTVEKTIQEMETAKKEASKLPLGNFKLMFSAFMIHFQLSLAVD